MIVNILNKQYDIQPCMMCGNEGYDIVEYHYDKDNITVIDAIKCMKCGKVYYTFNKLIEKEN